MANDGFFGTYRRIEDVQKQESGRLASNESVIGAALKLVLEETEEGLPVVEVQSLRGNSLGRFDSETASLVARKMQSGSTCDAYLSAVAYSEEAGSFWGEVALLCYPQEEEAVWKQFSQQAGTRIAHGEHPDLGLSSKSIARVIESKGTWCGMKSLPYENLPRGGVYFKKRRSFTDGLVDMATNGKVGCKIAAVVFWIALLAAAAYVVWRWFF